MTAPAWAFPRATSVVLGNGLGVRLLHMPGQLVASVVVGVALPSAVEPARAEGVLAATAAMLSDEGPRPGARAGRIARLGGTLTTGCDHRGPKVVADCPVAELPELLRALRSTVFGFSPTARALDVVLRRHRAERAHEVEDPFAQANGLLNEAVIAPTSRYARPLGGTQESLSRIRLDDVVGIAGRIDPACTTVVVAADLAGVDVAAAVTAAFGTLPSSGPAPVEDVAPRAAGGPRLVCRSGRGSAQTHLMVGSFGIDRTDERWPSARVVAELLGAGPDSLLNREVRGRLGLSYGMQARFLPFASGGLFVLSGAVDGRRSEEALDAVFRVLRELLAEGAGVEEVTGVRRRMVQSAPEIYESSLAVAQQTGELVSCGLAEDFVTDHLDRLRCLTDEQVLADARSLIAPDELSVVAVGRFDPDGTEVAALPRG